MTTTESAPIEPKKNRKALLSNAGCFSARRGAYLTDGKRGWCGAYVAEEQGIDSADGKYLVICEEHASCVQTTRRSDAVRLAGHGDSFCDDCRANEPKSSEVAG